MKATIINNQIQVVSGFRKDVERLTELCVSNGYEYNLHFTTKPTKKVTITMPYIHAFCDMLERKGLIEIVDHRNEEIKEAIESGKTLVFSYDEHIVGEKKTHFHACARMIKKEERLATEYSLTGILLEKELGAGSIFDDMESFLDYLAYKGYNLEYSVKR